MSKTKLTPSQEKAINFEGTNILVSAGAGSGKTSVLKDRVIRKLKSGILVDKLIILTFTNAAAFEMKQRIIDAINEDDSLKYQLKYLENATISTFDAFCLRLVSEYYYLLDLPSSISIGDTILIEKLKQDVLEKVIKSYYLKAEPQFVELVKLLFQKGDDIIYQTVLYLASKIVKLPDYENYFDSYEENHFSDKVLNDLFQEYEELINSELHDIYEDFLEFKAEIQKLADEKIISYINEFGHIYQVLDEEKDFNVLLKKLFSFSYPRRPKMEDGELKETIMINTDSFKERTAKIVNDIKDLNIETKAEAINAVLETKDRVSYILEITKVFIEELNIAKRDRNLYNFEDIMNFAIKLLENNENIRREFKNNINEIMVDEYQDTNDLQDYFISLIENNNIFMVGDIKQSIYGFRDANPMNFANKYKEYKDGKNGIAIDLRENFRSRKEVLEGINNIFSLVMDEKLGGINYRDNQGLIYGQKNYDKKADDQLHQIDAFIYDFEALKETDERLTKPEVEIEIIAKNIREKIDGNYQILDLKSEKFRDILYDDIAIIVDRKTDFIKYSSVLCKYNIPVNVISDEPFKSGEEMLFLFQYLLLLQCFKDNSYIKPYFQKALYSVARSFVFMIEDQIIIDFLANENVQEAKDLEIMKSYPKLREIHQKISEILPYIGVESNYDVLQRIYKSISLHSKTYCLENPEKSEAKLDYFILKIKSFSNFTFIDLIQYLENIILNNDIDIEYQHTKTVNSAVTLMTMHKSKGLQYPICFYPGLNKRFKLLDNTNFFLFDTKFGVVTKAYESGFYNTFIKTLLVNKTKTEYLSERIRLLYVALTRAKENAIIVSDSKNMARKLKKIDSNGYLSLPIRKRINSYSDILSNIELNNHIYSHLEAYRHELLLETKEAPKTEALLVKKIFRNDLIRVPKIGFSKKNALLLKDEQKDIIDYGNKIHEYLENVDFQHINDSVENYPTDIKSSIMYLVGTYPFEKIMNSRVLKEYEFIDENGSTGIIDLLIITEKEVFIIDYKLKNIDDDAYLLQLKGYKNHLTKHLNKPITTYLYSILNQELRIVEV